MGEMVGYRFHPTDEELVNYYLRHKILGNEFIVRDAINEVNICKFNPWELPMQSKLETNDRVWYFFCPKDMKYANSKRANRTTEAGFWKATGVHRNVRAKGGNREIIGTKKTLVFYTGRVSSGKRTDWVMHEYHPAFLPPNESPYCVCKVKDKAGERSSVPSFNGTETSHSVASNSRSLAVMNATMEVNQPPEQENMGSIPYNNCDLDFELALQVSAQEEGLYLSDIQDPNSSRHSAGRQVYNLPEDDQNFLNDLEYVDPHFVEGLFADQDEVAHENVINEYCQGYTPLESLTGVYAESGSEAEPEVTYTESYQDIPTSIVDGRSPKQPRQKRIDAYYGFDAGATSTYNAAPERLRVSRLQISRQVTPRYEGLRSAESSTASDHPWKRNSSIRTLETERKRAQDPYKKTTSTATPYQPSARIKKEKGSPFLLETIVINPPSTCLLNLSVGGLLFFITLWGMASVR